MIQAGKMDRRLTLQTLTAVQDSFGEAVESWTDYTPPLWCEARQPTGREVFASAQLNAQVDQVFVIRWRRDLSPTMRILYDGRTFDIYEISEIGRREGLMIKATVRTGA